MATTVTEVPFRAQQPEQARRPPAPTAKLSRLQSYREPLSAAGAVGAADRTRVGDQAHPLGRRTTRQNDGGRTPKGSAERHLRVRSRSASTLGIGQHVARSKPAIGGSLAHYSSKPDGSNGTLVGSRSARQDPWHQICLLGTSGSPTLEAARVSKFREPGCDSSNGREQEQHSYMPSRVPPTADEDNQHAVQLRFRRLKVPE
jgi:hypothetical protein